MTSYEHELDLSTESSEAELLGSWKFVSPGRISTAIDVLSTHLRPRSIYLTHQFGMRGSRYKERELLWAQGEVTNLTSAILADVWENLQRINASRRLPHGQHHVRIGTCSAAQMVRLHRHARARHGELLVFMRRFFDVNRDKQWLKANPRRALSFVLYRYYNARTGFTNRDYRITSHLRESAIQRCAGTMLLWTWHVADLERRARQAERQATQSAHSSTPADGPLSEQEPITSESEEQSTLPDKDPTLLRLLVRSYRTLSRLNEAYEHAGGQRIPRGRHTGKRLRQVQKRQLRKLLERLPESAVADEMRQHVLVLLNANTSPANRVKAAGSVRHLWRRRGRHQRAPRAGRLERSQSDRPGPMMELRELRPYELERYYNELTELQTFSTQVAALRHQIAIFLRGKPPSFPRVAPLPRVTHDAQLHQYQTALEWFSDPFPSSASPDNWGTYTPGQLEHFENQAKARLLQVAAALKEPHLHPLTFPRTMMPHSGHPQMSSFAVLYWTDTPTQEKLEQRYRRRVNFRKGKHGNTKQRRRPLSKSFRTWKVRRDLARGTRYRYALAVAVHGQTAFADYQDGRKGRQQRPRREDHSKLTPHMRRSYFFVNYPATPFAFPKRSSILIFPLTCTWVEHDEGLPHSDQLLQNIIRRQYLAQQELHNQQPALPLPACLPDPALSSAQIVSEVDPLGHRVFSLQLPVEYTVPPITAPIRNIIAFSEHGHSYYYAVITAAGHVIEVGRVPLPPNVQRQDEDGHVSETYVHELARAMVVLAHYHHAFTGIEDISYRRAQPTTSRSKNRERFSNPFSKLVTVLASKALLASLPAPHLTWGVPRQRACGQCGLKLPMGTVSTRTEQARSCHTCETEQPGVYVHVPVRLHAAAVVYHLPGVESLQCSAHTVAGIFLGAITRWNDARIVAENPGQSLPDLPIQVIRHADTPVVSTMLASYLCTASSWAAKCVRAGKRLLWNNLYGQPKTTIEVVKTKVGAVGCVVWTDSLHEGVGVVAIENGAGRCVTPTPQSITAAGEQIARDRMNDQQVLVHDAGVNDRMYPLTGITWLNIPREQTNRHRAQQAVKFLSWVVSERSTTVEPSADVSLPLSVQMLAQTRLNDVTVAGEPLTISHSNDHHDAVADANDQAARLVVIRATGAGAAAPEAMYQQWSESYRGQDPSLNIVFERVPPTAWQYARGTTPISDDQDVCTSCGTVCKRVERWSACIRCGTDLPSPYNIAIVTARKTVEQLVARYDVVQARRSETQTSSPDDITE